MAEVEVPRELFQKILRLIDDLRPKPAPFMLRLLKHRAQSMKETTINIIDGLRGQQAQLKRLLAQKVWISDAPRPELSEIEAQVIEVKRLLAELEKNIQDQLQRGQ